jgi:hypothetical protein
MNVQRRDFLLLVTLAAAAPTPVLGQLVAPAIGLPDNGTQSSAFIPDFLGRWAHPYWPGIEPPASGPGPVTNSSRLPGGQSNNYRFVGDYTNPVLKPEAAEVVKKHGEVELGGVEAPTPTNQCWPESVPYVFWQQGMQMFQQPDKITIIYVRDQQVRRVRMNQPHPVSVTPSWSGDSVGRYDGDTLVIDTVGIKHNRPLAMVDMYGTPYTEALHVLERYRLIDYEVAKEGLERNAKENIPVPNGAPSGAYTDPDYRGKYLQLQFTVEDEGVFTMPWSATITYGRPKDDYLERWAEYVCAENIQRPAGKTAAVPRAEKPDF